MIDALSYFAGVKPAMVYINEPFRWYGQQAELVNADLIVLSSHGRRGIGRTLMRSDAELISR